MNMHFCSGGQVTFKGQQVINDLSEKFKDELNFKGDEVIVPEF